MSLGVDQRKSRSASHLHRGEASSFTKLAEGFVTQRSPQTSSAVASGPRCVVRSDGEIVCSYMVQTALGSNDFVPMLSRSRDGGLTWREQGPIWPHLQHQYSVFGSISASSPGELYFYGTRTVIDAPGESFWCEANYGLKANSLVWSRSIDGGQHWSEPKPIPMPVPGAAEAPGPLCAASDRTWHTCYAPFNTFDPSLVVPRNQVVLLSSADQGRTWRHTAMLRFPEVFSTGAEAWVVELADGRLLGSCWNTNLRDSGDYPNPFAVSHDGGQTWSETRSTGIMGQSCSLTPLVDGSVLFVYNQRKHGRIGVWMAHARPTDDAFNTLTNEIVWEAPTPSAETSQNQWTQFTFGEPSATVLADGTILVALWMLDQGIGAIRFVKLKPRNQLPVPHGQFS